MQHELPPELAESLSASTTMESLSRFCSKQKSVSAGNESATFSGPSSASASGSTSTPTRGNNPTPGASSSSSSISTSAASTGASAAATASSGKTEWHTSSEAVNEALGLFVRHVVDVLVWRRRFPALPHDRRKLLELVRAVLERVLALDAAALARALPLPPPLLPPNTANVPPQPVHEGGGGEEDQREEANGSGELPSK